MVAVAAFAASDASMPPARITATRRRTRSVASAGSRSNWFAAGHALFGTPGPDKHRRDDDGGLQPWARESLRKLNARALSEPVFLTPKERCWPIGVPGWLLYPVTPVYFLQTPKEVVLVWQEDHMVRHIYLTDKHSPNVKPSWFGESIGHYENGDTLVIDTIGLSTGYSYIDNFRTPHTDKEHVVERYKMTADGKTLEASVTVEDPDTLNAPLHMLKRWRRATNPILETVCAENNGDRFSSNLFPIPQADKPDF
jgi:hypothetical protein